MHCQQRSEPLQIKAPASAAFARLAPSQCRKSRDHRVLDPDRGPDYKIAVPIESFLPDLSDECFVERDREEGRRRTVAHPERKASVADVNLAMRDDARLDAIALRPAPLHFKGFAFMDCHDHLRGRKIPSLDRAGGAVRECDRPRTQMLAEREPAGWFARCKVDQIMAQVPACDRSHRSFPTRRARPPNSCPA